MQRASFSVFFVSIATVLCPRISPARQVVDSLNNAFQPDPSLGVWAIGEVGWAYTPSESYIMTGVRTRFRDTPSPSPLVTLEIYDLPPSMGGTLLRSASFIPTADAFSGGSFAGLRLTAGRTYFVGFRNVGGLGANCTRPSDFDPNTAVCLGSRPFNSLGTYETCSPNYPNAARLPHGSPILQFLGSQTNVIPFGPKEYLRTAGNPRRRRTIGDARGTRRIENPRGRTRIVNDFEVSDVTGDYTMVIQNGHPSGERVTGAVVKLNGDVILTPSDLNSQVELRVDTVFLNQTNQLSVELRGKPDSSITLTIIRQPEPVMEFVPAGGGELSIPGFATVEFPAATFPTGGEVELSVAVNQESQDVFQDTGALVSAVKRLPFQLHITSFERPLSAIEITVPLADSVLGLSSVDSRFGLFAQVVQNGGMEILDHAELVSTKSSPALLSAALPDFAFSDDRRDDGVFEAIAFVGMQASRPKIPGDSLVIGTMPLVSSRAAPNFMSLSSFDVGEQGLCQLFLGDTNLKLLRPIQNDPDRCSNSKPDCINSEFGKRPCPNKPQKECIHLGVDFQVKEGTAVLAAAAGKVIFVGMKIDFGLTVQLEHFLPDPNRSSSLVPIGSTLYSHLSQVNVVPGRTVSAGDRIGLSGGRKGDPNAGNSTGPHLHFELMPYDPIGNTERGAKWPAERVDPEKCFTEGPENVTGTWIHVGGATFILSIAQIGSTLSGTWTTLYLSTRDVSRLTGTVNNGVVTIDQLGECQRQYVSTLSQDFESMTGFANAGHPDCLDGELTFTRVVEPEDLSGTWRHVGGATFILDMVQSGSTLSGTWTTEYPPPPDDVSPLTGTVNGREVTITQHGECQRLYLAELTADFLSMTGFAEARHQDCLDGEITFTRSR